MAQHNDAKPIQDSLKEYARGVTGGLLFSFPLLYTMEVWWAGFIAPPGALLLLICVTFIVLLGYNRFAGLRPDSSWREIAIDSVEELGIGFILSFSVLLILNRIHIGDMHINEIMGKVVIEAMAVSIGVSVGTAQLGTENGGKEEKPRDRLTKNGKMALVVLAICGSLLIGGNVAPTEEVLMIAVEAEPIHILAMSVTSIFLSIVVVYFSDFKGTRRERPQNFIFHIISDTCICYACALIVSAFVLWFFGRFEHMNLWIIFSQIIVLGVLSSLGASAGRLLIK